MAAPKTKIKKERILYYNDNHLNYLNVLKASKQPYTIVLSNYTMDIESEFMRVYFMQSVMGVKAFVAGDKIKKDILASKLPPPVIDKSELKYYEFAHESILSKNSSQIFNVDIKSAYANALNNSGILSESTFDYIIKLSKKDRLACLGMLASRKDIFTYENNIEVKHEKKINELENWFYFCVLQVQKVMEMVLFEIGSDFLFYWVDGIFFNGAENVAKVQSIIKECGYQCTTEICSNFSFIENGNTKTLQYTKENGKEKNLSLPKSNSKEVKLLLKHLKLIP